jgi:small lipoprotein (TIGR04454 family)
MNKYLLLLASLGLMAIIQCGGSTYTAEQCETSLNNVFDKISTNASEEDKAKFAPMKPTLMGKLKKDCMDGKFDLQCLDTASNIAAIQTCLR